MAPGLARVGRFGTGAQGETLVTRDPRPRFLVRYGVMGHVGRFPLDPAAGTMPDRGQPVVLRTDRGLELGEVLLRLEPEEGPGEATTGDDSRALLRLAGRADLEACRSAEHDRSEVFTRCLEILEDGEWPLDLIDVEPLLGTQIVVLHCLGPAGLDLSPLRARFRTECDFDVVFELLGADADSPTPPASSATEGRCAGCDCSGGGCSSLDRTGSLPMDDGADRVAGGCATDRHGGCSSCGVTKWLAARGR